MQGSDAGRDQARPPVAADERAGREAIVGAFVEEARGLRDEDLVALAEARRSVDEASHHRAWRAANEALAGRAEAYVRARVALGSAPLPSAVRDHDAGGDGRDWGDVARLARHALDDRLLALLASDVLRPDHIRALQRPWMAMLAARGDLPRPPSGGGSGS